MREEGDKMKIGDIVFRKMTQDSGIIIKKFKAPSAVTYYSVFIFPNHCGVSNCTFIETISSDVFLACWVLEKEVK